MAVQVTPSFVEERVQAAVGAQGFVTADQTYTQDLIDGKINTAYHGIATPATVPTLNQLSGAAKWDTVTAGTYPNMGGIVISSGDIADGRQIQIVYTPGEVPAWKRIFVGQNLGGYAQKIETDPLVDNIILNPTSELSNQLSNNDLMQNRSLNPDGNFGANSNSWISLPFQPVPSGTITASGMGAIGTGNIQYVIKNSAGTIVSAVYGRSASNIDPLTITVPAGVGYTIAFNIGAASNIFDTVATFKASFMLNVGSAALPFEPYSASGVTYKINKISIDYDFDSIPTEADLLAIDEKVDPLVNNIILVPSSSSSQLSNNALMQNRSLNEDGTFAANSNSWISLPFQPVPSGNITASGFVLGIGTGNVQWVIKNAAGAIVSTGMGRGVSNLTPLTIVVPSGTGHEIAFNIAAASNAFDNVASHRASFMLNAGTEALPFQAYNPTSSFKISPASIDYDFDSIPSDGGTASTFIERVYMSPTGSNSANGLTASTPILTFAKAKTLLKGQGELIMLGGDYMSPTLNLSDFAVIKARTGDRVRLIYGTKITSATLSAGYTRVYEAPLAGTINAISYLWQHDVEDEETVISLDERHSFHRGRRTRMPSTRIYHATSLAEIEANTTQLMWFKDSTKLYFSRASSNMVANPIVIPDNSIISASVEKQVNFSNIDFLYKPIATAKLSGKLTDMSVGMTNLSGAVIYDNTIGLTFERCEAYGSVNDGFNGHVYNSVTHKHSRQLDVMFVDCYGHDNKDDGDSAHEYSETSHHGGLFEYNGSAITPSYGAHTTCYNVMSRKNGIHPWSPGAKTSGFSALGSPTDGGVSNTIICYGCISIGDGIGFRGLDNSSKFVNCIAKDTVTTAFGTGEKINCVTI